MAVAGGGPAGLVAAILLARGGARVAVSSAPAGRFPRPGETLPGAGFRLLASLGLPAPAEGGPHRRLTGIATAWDGELVETDYLRSPDGPAWLLDRPAFDGALADAASAAGASFVQGPAKAERIEGGWRLGEVSAGFLVDSTGRSAALARRLGARTRIEHALIALWAVAEGEAPPLLERPMIERGGDGWWYSVRLSERQTYAAFHTAAESAPKARSPAQWRARLSSTRFLAPRLAGAGPFEAARGSPAGGSRLYPCRGEGWAACGDSALAFDPLSSQGVLGAMAGGHMLATALLSGNRERGLAAYEGRLAEIWRIYCERREAFYA